MNQENENYFKAIELMKELFGKDVPMSLATSNEDIVSVRVVDCYFQDSSFYITTYALSNKMNQINKNPHVALCKDLFQCTGVGKNIGHPLDENNKELREKLKQVFYIFYDRHVDETDPHTCFLKIDLEKAIVFDDKHKYIVDFVNKTAQCFDFINDIIL